VAIDLYVFDLLELDGDDWRAIAAGNAVRVITKRKPRCH
jgi:hypothetical protein